MIGTHIPCHHGAIEQDGHRGHVFKRRQPAGRIAGEARYRLGIGEFHLLLERVLKMISELGPERSSPIFEALGGMISYDELHVMLTHYLCS